MRGLSLPLPQRKPGPREDADDQRLDSRRPANAGPRLSPGKRAGLSACILIASTSTLLAGPAVAATPQQQIREVLTWSAQAWSRGDLDRFMQSYEHGGSTAFVVKDGLLAGHRAIRDRYAARYGAAPGPKAAASMGQLKLELMDVRMLGPTYALATGRYTLARAGKPNASGITSLLFHRSAAGWRIVYDHSS